MFVATTMAASPPSSASNLSSGSMTPRSTAATNRKGVVMGILLLVGCLITFQYQLTEQQMAMEDLSLELETLHAKNQQIHALQKELKSVKEQAAAKDAESLTNFTKHQTTMGQMTRQLQTLEKKNLEIAALKAELQSSQEAAQTHETENKAMFQEHLQSMEQLTQKLQELEAQKQEIDNLRSQLRAVNATAAEAALMAMKVEKRSFSKYPTNKTVPVKSGPSPEELANRPQLKTSQYTPHITELLQVIENVTLHLDDEAFDPWPFDPHKFCALGYHIFVDKPYSPPTAIECNPDNDWCRYFRKLFTNTSRILPYNVSIGESQGDMVKSKKAMGWGQCFASSGPDDGGFSMNNFQDMKAQMESFAKHGDAVTGYLHNHSRPWDERHKIPVFRGHPRMPIRPVWRDNPTHCAKHHLSSGEFGERSKAVLFSLRYPRLLDARVKHAWNPCQVYNATNGMDKLWGWGKYERKEDIQIPSSLYYTDYQVVVVLGGIGAAFRTPKHMSAGQAIVLQRFKYEEWFYQYMEPYKHYIPLKEDLSDLKEVMLWVKENPKKVKRIAQNGKKFYEEWLSFPHNDEHWYELIWRLAELIQDKGPERLKTGTHRTIWPAPIVPWRFVRDKKTGLWVEEERVKTRKPYLDIDGPRGDFTKP